MSSLQMLVPGQGLGPFTCGQPLPVTLSVLQTHRGDYPCLEILHSSPDKDVELRFPDHGFSLLFEPRTQRLRLVKIFDTSRIRLRCGPSASIFGGASNLPTFGGLYRAFGPTYPTDPDPGSGAQTLIYPAGLLCLFPANASPLALDSRDDGAAIPFNCPASRICVFAGGASTAAAALAAPPPPLPSDSAYMGLVEVVPGQGVHFAVGGRVVRLGDSPQEVVAELGDPDAVYALPLPSLPGGAPSDYFYNYFGRGIDVMFTGEVHVVKKIVLHANAVAHPEFATYTRCNFRVHVSSGWSLAAPAALAPPAVQPSASFGAAPPQGQAEEAARPCLHPPAARMVDTASVWPGVSDPPAAEGTRVTTLANGAAAMAGSDGQAHGQGPTSGGPSRLTAAYSMLVDLVEDVFTVGLDEEVEQEQAPPPVVRQQQQQLLGSAKAGKGKKKKVKGKPPRPPAQGAAARHSGTSPADGEGGLRLHANGWAASDCAGSPSPGTSPGAWGGSSVGGLRRGPSMHSALGSAASSSVDFAAKEDRLETGSQYYDGWSDADELSALCMQPVATPAQQEPGRVTAAVQTDTGDAQAASLGSADMWTSPTSHLSHDGSHAAWSPVNEAAAGSPSSFVSIGEDHAFADGVADFENVPRVRTCSTQTAQHLLAAVPQPAQAAAAAAASLSAAAQAAACNANSVVTVDGTIADLERAFGELGKPALHPRMGAGWLIGEGAKLYGFPGVVFEVQPDGSIATVTIFSAEGAAL